MRGPAGQPVDVARADGFNEAIAGFGRKVELTEVVGNWNPGDAQKVTADAIAAGGKFDGIYVEGGSQGAAQAMIDAGKFLVPIAGEDENAFRLLCNANHDKGMHCQVGRHRSCPVGRDGQDCYRRAQGRRHPATDRTPDLHLLLALQGRRAGVP